MGKLKKSDLINELVVSLNPCQVEIIEKLLGREVTSKTLITQFTKTFKKTIKISSRKGKARNLQKWVCEHISQITGLPWGKDEEIVSREMGQGGTDVRLSKNALSLFPFSIECKDQETWSISNFIKQAQDNQLENTNWLLVLKKSDIKPVCVMDADSFFQMLKNKPLLLKRRIK